MVMMCASFQSCVIWLIGMYSVRTDLERSTSVRRANFRSKMPKLRSTMVYVLTWNVLSQYGWVWVRCHCGLLVRLLRDKGLALLQLIGEYGQDAEKQAAPEGAGGQTLVRCHGPGDHGEDERPYQDGDSVPKGFEDEFHSDSHCNQCFLLMCR